MGLVGRALKDPYAVVVAELTIVIVGVTMIFADGRRYPADVLDAAVQIITFYPGMPAEIVEQDIATRLERWTGQANGIARQPSKSMVGVSIVKDFFRLDIDPNTAMSMTSSSAMSDLRRPRRAAGLSDPHAGRGRDDARVARPSGADLGDLDLNAARARRRLVVGE